jgi:polyisoprenoid-binding protein YceI
LARFEILPEQSTVAIDAKSSVHPIHSETHGLEGYVDIEIGGDGAVDASATSSGRLELSTDRLESGNALYDREMRRRIDSRRFPKITGELVSVKEGPSRGRYLVAGDLTFHGTTQHYEEEMEITGSDGTTVALKGSHVFDIRQFGVEPPKMMMLRVHPDVAVRVDILARRED